MLCTCNHDCLFIQATAVNSVSCGKLVVVYLWQNQSACALAAHQHKQVIVADMVCAAADKLE